MARGVKYAQVPSGQTGASNDAFTLDVENASSDDGSGTVEGFDASYWSLGLRIFVVAGLAVTLVAATVGMGFCPPSICSGEPPLRQPEQPTSKSPGLTDVVGEDDVSSEEEGSGEESSDMDVDGLTFVGEPKEAPISFIDFQARAESKDASDVDPLSMTTKTPMSWDLAFRRFRQSREEGEEDDKDGHKFYKEGDAGCKMSDAERCPVSAMKRDEWNNVFPGGETRCLLSTAPTYAFQVIRGDSDKLVIYFQGGGSCWDQTSTMGGGCNERVQRPESCGLFDRSNDDNPYKQYSVVHIGYCSGDAHAGHKDRPTWRGSGGARVEQRGYVNAKSAVDWAYDNFGRSRLKALVVTGCSAGSLGAQFWAYNLLRLFSYEDASVIADSYAGIFPTGVQGAVQKDVGVCETDLLSQRLKYKCEQEGLEVPDVYIEAMRTYPDVSFGSINSKTDKVQMAFFSAIHLTLKHTPYFLSPSGFFNKLSTIETFYASQPNFVIYDVNSAQHCYTNQKYLYSTVSEGDTLSGIRSAQGMLRFPWQKKKEEPVKGKKMAEWLADLPVARGASAKSECSGTLGKGTSLTGWKYCTEEATRNIFYRGLG